MQYNLLKEEWIPVLYHNGDWKRVGILKALQDAGQIRQIATSNPMDRVAVLRFLLAIVYWCGGNPPDNSRSSPKDSFPIEWFDKLKEYEDCFNLLGDGKRFYQDETLKTHSPENSVNYLLHEIPCGTNKWHFQHAVDQKDGLCPACAILGLIRVPAYITPGGKGYSAGINRFPSIYSMPIGESLNETIRLSWIKNSHIGTPEWISTMQLLPIKGVVTLLLGLTVLLRRIWLGELSQKEEVCISCGSKEQIIKKIVFKPVKIIKHDEKIPARNWKDPHLIPFLSNKGMKLKKKEGNTPTAKDSASGHWIEEILGIFESQKVNDSAFGIWNVSFSTDSNARFDEAVESRLPRISKKKLNESVIDGFEKWKEKSSKLTINVISRLKKQSELHKKRKYKDIESIISSIRPHVEHQVAAKVSELLTGDETKWQNAAREYKPMMEAISKTISPGVTTTTVKTRRMISNTLPDMSKKGESK